MFPLGSDAHKLISPCVYVCVCVFVCVWLTYGVGFAAWSLLLVAPAAQTPSVPSSLSKVPLGDGISECLSLTFFIQSFFSLSLSLSLSIHLAFSLYINLLHLKFTK